MHDGIMLEGQYCIALIKGNCIERNRKCGIRLVKWAKIHLGGEGLPCQECGVHFAKSGALEVHMTKEHPHLKKEWVESLQGTPIPNSTPDFASTAERVLL